MIVFLLLKSLLLVPFPVLCWAPIVVTKRPGPLEKINNRILWSVTNRANALYGGWDGDREKSGKWPLGSLQVHRGCKSVLRWGTSQGANPESGRKARGEGGVEHDWSREGEGELRKQTVAKCHKQRPIASRCNLDFTLTLLRNHQKVFYQGRDKVSFTF